MKSLLLLLLCFVQGSWGYRVVCVYTNWSQYRPDGGKFLPEDVDSTLCTHLIYVYAKLKGNKLEPTEWNDEGSAWSEGMYERVNNLKQINPELKTLLGVGGWMMGSKDFSKLAAGRASRRIFAKTTVKFLRDRTFDGLSIDWQHPTKRGGKPQDKVNFSLLLKELRKAFEDDRKKSGLPSLLLTTGLSASREIIDDGYEIDNITKYTDFINVMAYDLHGAWDNYTGHPSQLYPREEEFGPSTEINVDAAMRYWMSNVPDRSKLVLGVSTYGRTFTLRKTRHNDYNVPTTGPGIAGEFTQQPGMIAYYERCSQYADAPRIWDATSQVAYWHSGDQWIAGEDVESIRAKVNWTRTNEIGGMMVWSLDTDDFVDKCLGEVYPLLKTVANDLNDPSFLKTNTSFSKLSAKTTEIKPNTGTTEVFLETKIPSSSSTKAPADKLIKAQNFVTNKKVASKPSKMANESKNVSMDKLRISDKNKATIAQQQNQQRRRKTQEQQQKQGHKQQDISTAKPNKNTNTNAKPNRRMGKRRRLNPQQRRKMFLQRRKKWKGRPGPGRGKKRMIKRRPNKKQNKRVETTTQGNNGSDTNNAFDFDTKLTGDGVNVAVDKELQEVNMSINKNENAKFVKLNKNLSSLNNGNTSENKKDINENRTTKPEIKEEIQRRNATKETKKDRVTSMNISNINTNPLGARKVDALPNDIIITKEHEHKQEINKSFKKQDSIDDSLMITFGKTIKIARKRKPGQIIIAKRKNKGIRKTVKISSLFNRKETSKSKAGPTSNMNKSKHSKDKLNIDTSVVTSKNISPEFETTTVSTSATTSKRDVSTFSTTSDISNNKSTVTQLISNRQLISTKVLASKPIKKPQRKPNNKMRRRRRRKLKNGKRLKLRRRRKKRPTQSPEENTAHQKGDNSTQ